MPRPIDADSVHFSSAYQDWETPQWLVESLSREFPFTLDVCALPHNAKVARYFTPDDNGLAQDWGREVCWCNPPYAQIMQWVEKAYTASLGGATVVILANSRTDTRWFHFCLEHGAEVRFIKGRVKFTKPGSKHNAPFPSVLIIFRPKGI